VDKVVGLELGADDYATEAVQPARALARIKAVCVAATKTQPAGNYRFADITMDLNRCEAVKNGRKIDLTATEFKLLRAFLEHRGQVLTIDRILRRSGARTSS
jgi:DNA-binding response OmpR family regulator